MLPTINNDFFSDTKSDKTEQISFLSEPDENTKKNSTGVDVIKAPEISCSEIQNEGTFDQSFDDDLVLAMRSFSALTNELEKDGSIVFEDSGIQSKSECPDIRSWIQIGDVMLKSDNSNAKDAFSIKILGHKVCYCL